MRLITCDLGVLLVGTVGFAETLRYTKSTHGGGDIQVILDASGDVTTMRVPTSLGAISIAVVSATSSSAEYEIDLVGTTEQVDMTFSDGGSGTTDVEVDFGTAGAVTFTLEVDKSLTPVSTTLTDCEDVTDSDIYQALLIASASTEVAHLDYNKNITDRAYLVYTANIPSIAVSAVHIQDSVECEPMVPNLFWHLCPDIGDLVGCVSCCAKATEAAALAMAWPCLIAAGVSGGSAAMGCLIALGAAEQACEMNCAIANPVDPVEEGGVCGWWPHNGSCLHWCPSNHVDGGQQQCDPPLTCCIPAL